MCVIIAQFKWITKSIEECASGSGTHSSDTLTALSQSNKLLRCQQRAWSKSLEADCGVFSTVTFRPNYVTRYLTIELNLRVVQFRV